MANGKQTKSQNKLIMKKIINSIIALWLLSIPTKGISQQDPHYTQFMFNKLAFNPAYAGSAKGTCLIGLYRNQWVGFEGHPITQVIGLHTSLKDDRVGLGLNMVRDRIGPTTSINIQGSYAYRIPLGTGDLAFGLMARIHDYKLDFSDAQVNEAFDLLIESPDANRALINAGAGVYYENERFYAGISVPRLIKNDISLLPDDVDSGTNTAVEETHAYLMAGALFPLSEKVQLKPAALLKYARNTPLNFDLHAGLLLNELVYTGLTYRLGEESIQNMGESIDVVLQLYLNDFFTLGGAFDFTLSELADFQSGSFEILLQYCFIRDREKVTNPRFF